MCADEHVSVIACGLYMYADHHVTYKDMVPVVVYMSADDDVSFKCIISAVFFFIVPSDFLNSFIFILQIRLNLKPGIFLFVFWLKNKRKRIKLRLQTWYTWESLTKLTKVKLFEESLYSMFCGNGLVIHVQWEYHCLQSQTCSKE